MNTDNANIDAAILDAIGEGIYCVDRNMTVLRWNRTAEEITGYMMENLVGKTCRGNLMCHLTDDGTALCFDQCLLKATLSDGQSRSASLFVRNRDAKRIPVFAKSIPIYGDEGVTAALAILSPYSEEMKDDRDAVIDSVSEISLTDRLTGLYNRRYFEGEVGVRVSQRKDEGRRTVLSFFNIDNFGDFNNTYGHDAGDEVLHRIAWSLEACFRKTDIFCRWGGEEFACLHDFYSISDLAGIGKKLQKTIAAVEIDWYGDVLNVTASVGVTEIKDDDTAESVIRRVNALMRQSKQNGKNQYTVDGM